MKDNRAYVQLYFECDVDELFVNFVDELNKFVRSYNGRLEEFLSSRITTFKGIPYDDPWKEYDLKHDR